MAIKRIVIISIIAFCLLSFIEISCLAKEPYDWGEYWNFFSVIEQSVLLSGIHLGILKGMTDEIEHYIYCFSPPMKSELIHYATMAEMEPEKIAKILAGLIVKEPGVLRKREESLIAIMGIDILHKFMKLSESAGQAVVVNVITDLYEDPANAYISIPEIYILALRKLKGESIESSLRELREEALR